MNLSDFWLLILPDCDSTCRCVVALEQAFDERSNTATVQSVGILPTVPAKHMVVCKPVRTIANLNHCRKIKEIDEKTIGNLGEWMMDGMFAGSWLQLNKTRCYICVSGTLQMLNYIPGALQGWLPGIPGTLDRILSRLMAWRALPLARFPNQGKPLCYFTFNKVHGRFLLLWISLVNGSLAKCQPAQ